jgi:hypothetical protein
MRALPACPSIDMAYRAHFLNNLAAASYCSATCSALRPSTVQTAFPAHS